ncbi:class I SAM-dependent methyltransferase [Halobacillus sp. B23F22_1]|uniref:class I SAM-dependent methyltransferase n=1 Tax=Halobacillus sp. B23F22_1 TaxID=3459514 RepID=UPI00373E262B
MLNFYKRMSSEIYDIDKPIGHSFGDVEFYKECLDGVSGPILEPAVGTGRILIPLLEAGLDVEGFDLSDEMLAICRKNCEEHNFSPRLHQGRMESFPTERKYDAIIIPTGTFLLLHKRNESIQSLEECHSHLNKEGKLILDVFVPKEFSIGRISTKTWHLDNGDIITLEDKLVEVDFINQYTISHNRYERWREGKLVETELEQFPLRWYGVEEFRLLLNSLGFEDITISSDYSRYKSPAPSTEIITFEATAVHT